MYRRQRLEDNLFSILLNINYIKKSYRYLKNIKKKLFFTYLPLIIS